MVNPPNLNYLWAGLLVEELVRQGVTAFGVAPGSRSSPLAISAAQHPRGTLKVHVDERGLGFWALGHARGSGRPAAVIVTSGTAVANLLPAVVEAAQEHVPMVLLTADRPPELRERGANQSIVQHAVLATQVRWHVDMPAPSAEVPLSYVLDTVDHACRVAAGVDPGPVHLNAAFREPLAPALQRYPRSLWKPLARWLTNGEPWTTHAPVACEPDHAVLTKVGNALSRCARGVVLAGRQSAEEAEVTLRLARRWGWPVFADVRSPARWHRADGDPVFAPDVLLGVDAITEAMPCDAVLQVGRGSSSARLSAYLKRSEPAVFVQLDPFSDRHDPHGLVTHRLQGDVVRSLALLAGPEAPVPTPEVSWLAGWQRAQRRANKALDRQFAQARGFAEPHAARLIAGMLPEHHVLWLGNSLPIRLVDAWAASTPHPVRAEANRGASGIDGLVASACGLAEGCGRPVTALVGDLSLLHDLNSLRLLSHSRQPVVLVVFNNDGGGIFSFLPIAEPSGPFEQVFAAPHGLDFRGSASMFGLPYRAVRDAASLRRAYRAAVRSGVSSVIEVACDRAATLRASRRLRDRIHRVLSA